MKKDVRSEGKKILGIWVFFAVVVTPVLLFMCWRSFQYSRYSDKEEYSYATLIKFHPEDHTRYDYVFYVNENSYKGRDFFLNGEKKESIVGSREKIYYYRDDPNINSSSHLNIQQYSWVYGFFAWLFFLIFVTAITIHHRRKTK